MQASTDTSVALLIFNRPDTTARVFETVRAARPRRLFVVADGPRAGHPDDVARCAAARRVTEAIDWECEVHRRYSERNLGCRRSVTDGLDWVFSNVEEAIVLEDDCLPDPTFFPFCETLLGRYRDDARIGMISGNNFQFGAPPVASSYYYSRHCHIWGWATWRRAWDKMDLSMTGWRALRGTGWLRGMVGRGPQEFFWRQHFDDAMAGDAGGLKTWDIAWTFSCWASGMLAIAPAGNLVSNVGFGEESTHTSGTTRLAQIPCESASFPLTAPSALETCVEADLREERSVFYGASPLQRLFWSSRVPIPLKTLIAAKRRLRSLARRPQPH